jgi:hypothetical protein
LAFGEECDVRVGFTSADYRRQRFFWVGFPEIDLLSASADFICSASFGDCGVCRIDFEGGSHFLHRVCDSVVDIEDTRLVRCFGSYTQVNIAVSVELLEPSCFGSSPSIARVTITSICVMSEFQIDCHSPWSDGYRGRMLLPPLFSLFAFVSS